MSMLALPGTECQEILALFRHHLPHLPDAWLQELASNYGLDAVVDIDPNDVISILSVPGDVHRIQFSLAAHEQPDAVCRRMQDALLTRGIEPEQIAASVLTLHDSSTTLKDIGEIVGRVSRACLSKGRRGWCWYMPPSEHPGMTIGLFLIRHP